MLHCNKRPRAAAQVPAFDSRIAPADRDARAWGKPERACQRRRWPLDVGDFLTCQSACRAAARPPFSPAIEHGTAELCQRH